MRIRPHANTRSSCTDDSGYRTDGTGGAGLSDASVHDPVHGRDARSSGLVTVRNIDGSGSSCIREPTAMTVLRHAHAPSAAPAIFSRPYCGRHLADRCWRHVRIRWSNSAVDRAASRSDWSSRQAWHACRTVHTAAQRCARCGSRPVSSAMAPALCRIVAAGGWPAAKNPTSAHGSPMAGIGSMAS